MSYAPCRRFVMANKEVKMFPYPLLDGLDCHEQSHGTSCKDAGENKGCKHPRHRFILGEKEASSANGLVGFWRFCIHPWSGGDQNTL